MMPIVTATSASYSVIESRLESKHGSRDGGEDRILLGQLATGVIDGATDKSGKNWGKQGHYQSSGSFLADQIVDAFRQSDSFPVVINLINRAVANRAELLGIDLANPNFRPQASFCIYLPAKEQIIQIGDCQLGFKFDDGNFKTYEFGKKVDFELSLLRKNEIERLLAMGEDPFPDKRDLGREKILPLLMRLGELTNPTLENRVHLGNTFWAENLRYEDLFYEVIDGVNIPDCRTIQLPKNTREIILCSDGYPQARPSLTEAEADLKILLRDDPQAFKILPSTKGLLPGQVSFDDRSYLRIMTKR